MPSRPSPPPVHHHINSLPLILTGSLTLTGLFLLIILLYRKLNQNRTTLITNSYQCKRFSYTHLRNATNSFSESTQLGHGGFGSVYKASFPNSPSLAVKVMDSSSNSLQGEREFHNELSLSSHLMGSPYIVSLLGFSTDKRGKSVALVYELMEKRSLQDALLEERCVELMEWRKRFEIVSDVAKGLEFLHCVVIVHGDIKPSNVLLDGEFRAKISDFGLARVLKSESLVDGRDNNVSRVIKSEALGGWCYESRVMIEEDSVEETESVVTVFEESSSNVVVNVSPETSGVSVLTETERSVLSPEGISVLTEAERSVLLSENCGKSVERSVLLSENCGNSVEGSVLFSENCGKSVERSVLLSENCRKSVERSVLLSENCGMSVERSGLLSENCGMSVERSVLLSENCGMSVERLVLSPAISVLTEVEASPGVESSVLSPAVSVLTEVEASPGVELSLLSPGGGVETMSVGSGGKRKVGMKRDWWWKQDGNRGNESGSVKDYVMEWIGSEIKKERPSGGNKEWVGDGDGSTSKKKKKEKKRKPREWWKEEFCEELTRKKRKKKKKKRRGLSSISSIDTWFHRDEDASEMDRNPAKRKKRNSIDWWVDGLSGEVKSVMGRKNSQDSGLWCDVNVQKSGGVSSTPSMRGTVCYIAPECGGGGALSEKCDVYSLGVLLLVVVSGRRPLQVTASPMSEFERANLISWAKQLACNGKLLDLVDKSIHSLNKEQAVLCITIALLCLQRSPVKRPTMKEIVQMLSGASEPPHLPFEFSPSPPMGFPFKSRKKTR